MFNKKKEGTQQIRFMQLQWHQKLWTTKKEENDVSNDPVGKCIGGRNKMFKMILKKNA